jgi:hypothetical protein
MLTEVTFLQFAGLKIELEQSRREGSNAMLQELEELVRLYVIHSDIRIYILHTSVVRQGL